MDNKLDFSQFLDLLGMLGGIDPNTFEDEKKEIMESGISMEDMMGILGDNFMSEFNGTREIIKLPIQKLTTDAKVPTYAHMTDACADLYASEDVEIQGGQTALVPTGIALAIPEGCVVHLFPRSSIGAKTPLRLANSVGVIDSGYRDEIKVIYTNTSDAPYFIHKGDRIAQMNIEHMPMANFQLVDDVKSIGEDRGGGIGSTGLITEAAESDGKN